MLRVSAKNERGEASRLYNNTCLFVLQYLKQNPKGFYDQSEFCGMTHEGLEFYAFLVSNDEG
ncbi:MAG TPA: hypothetical protein EYP59_07200 [Thiotrichaceae bacterium]|nr:hypothetical protein [Thiotrichaceae bacterium]